jgi:hypothetical protein
MTRRWNAFKTFGKMRPERLSEARRGWRAVESVGGTSASDGHNIGGQ